MELAVLILGAIVLYSMTQQSSVIAALSNPRPIAATANAPAPTPTTTIAKLASGQPVTPSAVTQLSSATSGAVGAALGPTSLSGTAVNAISGGVGALVGIFASLWSAHEQRLKAATQENTAVNAGVSGFDQAVQTINSAYNNDSATPAECVAALQQVMANYWAEVTPVIQSGRNGCAGGAACPSPTQPGPNAAAGGYYGVGSIGNTYCSGDEGAACCVGCVDLAPSIQNCIKAIQNGGGNAAIYAVGASSYGTVARPTYILNFKMAS